MNSDIATLVLVPLSVGLLLLYLKQMSKVNELRAEAESKREKIEHLSESLKKSAAQYNEALRAANRWYHDGVDYSEQQKIH